MGREPSKRISCPRCGKPTRYVSEYRRRYCDECKRFVFKARTRTRQTHAPTPAKQATPSSRAPAQSAEDKPTKMTKKKKLRLLEERMLKGEISEETYNVLRKRYGSEEAEVTPSMIEEAPTEKPEETLKEKEDTLKKFEIELSEREKELNKRGSQIALKEEELSKLINDMAARQKALAEDLIKIVEEKIAQDLDMDVSEVNNLLAQVKSAFAEEDFERAISLARNAERVAEKAQHSGLELKIKALEDKRADLENREKAFAEKIEMNKAREEELKSDEVVCEKEVEPDEFELIPEGENRSGEVGGEELILKPKKRKSVEDAVIAKEPTLDKLEEKPLPGEITEDGYKKLRKKVELKEKTEETLEQPKEGAATIEKPPVKALSLEEIEEKLLLGEITEEEYKELKKKYETK